MRADGVLTIQEAADYLKVTRQTVHALINRGQVRRYKVGRLSRIPAADVYALVGQTFDTEEVSDDAA